MKSMHPYWVGGVCAALLAAVALPAADTIQTARELFGKHKDSVVTVSATIKLDTGSSGVRMRGGDSQDTEVCGTVVDASGLTAVSYTALNPLEGVVDSIKQQLPEGAEDKVNIKLEMTRLKLRTGDGSEVSGRIVFKDKDLDLAFVVPDPKDGETTPKFSALEFKDGPAAKELDEMIFVTRLNKKLSYQPGVMVGRISGIVSKPRTIYDFSLSSGLSTGIPVFNADGKLFGFIAILKDTSGRAAAAMAAEHIIMPAGDLVPLIEQAKKAAAKKEEKSEK